MARSCKQNPARPEPDGALLPEAEAEKWKPSETPWTTGMAQSPVERLDAEVLTLLPARTHPTKSRGNGIVGRTPGHKKGTPREGCAPIPTLESLQPPARRQFPGGE